MQDFCRQQLLEMYETKDAYGLAGLNYQLIWNLFYEAFVIESNNASNSKEKHEYERMMQIREELIQALNPSSRSGLDMFEIMYGFFTSVSFGISEQEVSESSEQAKLMAKQRHANDPKQKTKAQIKELWVDWQALEKPKERYKGKAVATRIKLTIK